MSQYESPLLDYDDGLDDLSPFPDEVPDSLRPSQDLMPGLETLSPVDAGWGWHETRLIAVDRGEAVGNRRYEIGAIDVYANINTGDLGGSYLPLISFAEEIPAAAFYHDLQREMHEQDVTSYDVADYAGARAAEIGTDSPIWRAAGQVEYAAYEIVRDQDVFDPVLADEPPDEALDPLIQTAIELGGVVVEQDLDTEPPVNQATFQALHAIGIQAENFDPATDPPPFYDEKTDASYWIGVFQSDKADPENCITSILSLRRNPDTGEMEAQLAPCVPGDWDKAYSTAEYLLQIADRGGIEQVFDAAEGMALATDQRGEWETEHGIPLELDAARDIADRARDAWELEL